jgi:hypothetical protein
MLICAAILFTCYIVFPRLLKKQGSKYPKHWRDEAEDAVNWTKNFLQEKRNDFS